MEDLLCRNILKVEKLTAGSKLNKFFHRPFNYCFSFFYRFIFYKFFKQSIRLSTSTFFGKKLVIDFPSCNDIFITGAKTHSSEIRLTKFLIKNIRQAETFIDIGAHVGYFSLLANEISQNGKIFSFEPTQKTFQLLRLNTNHFQKIKIENLALSDNENTTTFFVADSINSEYNSLSSDVFVEKNISFAEQKIQNTTFDNYFSDKNLTDKTFIKIDTEGAEMLVLKGATKFLKSHSPIVMMEYLQNSSSNNYENAVKFLSSLNYNCYCINNNGDLQLCPDITNFMQQENSDSENLVFKK